MPSRVLEIGERIKTVNGYVRLKTGPGRTKYEHVAVAERAVGRPLPLGSSVHHVDDNGLNNVGANLCILQDEREHHALHYRRNVLRAGGNPWTHRICSNCGPQPIANFYQRSRGGYCRHCRACNTEVCRRERDQRASAQAVSM